MVGITPRVEASTEETSTTHDTVEEHEARVKEKLDRMHAAMSGVASDKWPPNGGGLQDLPVLLGGTENTLETRATRLIHWVFAILNVPRSVKRQSTQFIATEFNKIFVEWRNVQQDVDAYKLALCRHLDVDYVAGRSAWNDTNPSGRRLNEMHRKIAYAYEVFRRIKLLWVTVSDLLYMQGDSSGNIYDMAVAGEIHLTSREIRELAWLSVPGVAPDPNDKQKKKDMQLVVDHLLELASKRRYRKRCGVVYEQKWVDWKGKRYGTNAWIPASFGSCRERDEQSSMESFVWYFCRKDVYPDIWDAFMRCQPAKKIVEVLNQCDESDFPFVHPSRNILSFRNGIYDTTASGNGAWYPYGESSSREVASTISAAKYFDLKLDTKVFSVCSRSPESWWDVETPLFQSILDYQEFGGVGSDCNRHDSAAKDETSNTSDFLETFRFSMKPSIMAELLTDKIQDEYLELEQQLQHKLYDLKRIEDEAELITAARGVADFISGSSGNLGKFVHEAVDTHIAASSDATPTPPLTAAASGGCRSSSGARASQTRKRTRLPQPAQKWIYIFMGRMLHELGVYDKWQIVPFIKGRGGSGKSTVAQVVKHFFEASDVGILSNNSEKKFGLQALIGKFMWLCLELKKNVSLDQAEFQSMVSGEDLCVAIKNQVARQLRWTAPGMLCGNESPSWIDAQGSIARRLAIITFPYSVQEKHALPDLLARILKEELGRLLVKCNVAYRSECSRNSGADIWKILPFYFKDERTRFQRDTDAVYATIYDQKLFELWIDVEDCRPSDEWSTWFVSLSNLETQYRQKWRDLMASNYPDPFTPEKYSSAFESASLVVVHDTRQDPIMLIDRLDFWVVGIRDRMNEDVR